MPLLTRKKKYPFQIELVIEELTAVPFVSAVLFCKVHLLNGGKFVGYSSSEEVNNHTVNWNAQMMFHAKMCAPTSTGVLDPCICRISVRKEAKGGRSYLKLGYAEVNLSEMAGQKFTRRYLLEGHSSRQRQDNSMLKVTVHTTMLSGDPCFRTPVVKGLACPTRESVYVTSSGTPSGSCVTRGAAGTAPPRGPLTAGAAGGAMVPIDLFTLDGSSADTMDANLPLPDECSADGEAEGACAPPDADSVSVGVAPASLPTGAPASASGCAAESEGAAGHSRNSSSQSGYGSLNSQGQSQHSRQSSDPDTAVASGCGFSDYNSMERVQARCRELAAGSRFESTRVDPESVVNDLLMHADLNSDLAGAAESSGLQLYVGRDGSTAFSSQDAAGPLEPVVICKR